MERLRELIPGNKYTLVGFGEFGFLYQIQMTLKEVRVEPYAQYPVSYVLVFVPERKRSARQVRFYDDRKFIVWDGWVYPNTEMYVRKQVKLYDSQPVTIQESWTCFDQRYLTRAKLSVEQAPIIENLYYKSELQKTY